MSIYRRQTNQRFPRIGEMPIRWMLVLGILFISSLPLRIEAMTPSSTSHPIILKVELADGSASHQDSRGRIPRFCEGDILRFSATTNLDGYLSIFLKSSDGQTMRLFPPNDQVTNGRIKASETVVLPGKEADYQIEVAGPFGTEEVIALLTRERLPDSVLPEHATGVLGERRQIYVTIEGPPQNLRLSIERNNDRDALVLPLAVYFAQGSAKVRGKSNWAVLQLAGDALQKGNLSRMQLRIEGHCDSTGDPLANLNLGKARAAAVAVVLEELGIDRHRMIVDSRGDYEPAVETETPETSALNRRVEIRVIDPAGPRVKL